MHVPCGIDPQQEHFLDVCDQSSPRKKVATAAFLNDHESMVAARICLQS